MIPCERRVKPSQVNVIYTVIFAVIQMKMASLSALVAHRLVGAIEMKHINIYMEKQKNNLILVVYI